MARTPIHPGEILADELQEIGLSAKRLADLIEVPPNRLYQLLAGKRNITADTALRLGRYFRHVARFLDEPPERLCAGSGAPAERQSDTANSEAQRCAGRAAARGAKFPMSRIVAGCHTTSL